MQSRLKKLGAAEAQKQFEQQIRDLQQQIEEQQSLLRNNDEFRKAQEEEVTAANEKIAKQLQLLQEQHSELETSRQTQSELEQQLVMHQQLLQQQKQQVETLKYEFEEQIRQAQDSSEQPYVYLVSIITTDRIRHHCEAETQVEELQTKINSLEEQLAAASIVCT